MTHDVAQGWGPPWARAVLGGLAAAYFAVILAGGAGQGWVRELPGSVLYFTQVACLFPKAGQMAIEWRVEGWRCEDRSFVELDARPYFPILADGKESRLHRVGFFYRQERPVMEALENYLTTEVNADAPPNERIGGIRLLSVRHPLPAIDHRPVERFIQRPLAEIPADRHKHWFYTPESRRTARCAEVR